MFHNANLNNLGNILQRNLRAERARECIFKAFGGTILKVYPLGSNHGGAFSEFHLCTGLPKKIMDTSLMRDESWLI